MEKRAKTIVSEDLNQVRQHRREKLEALRKMGIEPMRMYTTDLT